MIPLTVILHGDPGSGKSTLALSGPGPRLVIDAEAGAHHAHRVVNGKIELAKLVRWNPLEALPSDIEDTCVVSITNYAQLETILDVLQSGRHPFKTVIMDSITEVQQRLHDGIRTEKGREQFQQADWGTSRTRLTTMVREFRDLSIHPDNPVSMVIFVALTTEKGDQGKLVKWPNLQGGASKDFPGSVDVVGYVSMGFDEEGEEAQGLLLAQRPDIIAKTRSPLVRMNWGSVITNANLEEIHTSIQNLGA